MQCVTYECDYCQNEIQNKSRGFEVQSGTGSGIKIENYFDLGRSGWIQKLRHNDGHCAAL